MTLLITFAALRAQRRYILAVDSRHEDVSSSAVGPSLHSSPSLLITRQERRRLDAQHQLYKWACDGFTFLPEVAPVFASAGKVMDVGCGTNAWLRDLRRSGCIPSDAVLHASDIDAGVFGGFDRKDIYGGDSHVSFFALDVLQPFLDGQRSLHRPKSEIRRGTYDVVHARLLVYALGDGEEWDRAIGHMKTLLSECNGVDSKAGRLRR